MPRSIGAILMLNALANFWYIVQLHQKTKKEEKAAAETGEKKPVCGRKAVG